MRDIKIGDRLSFGRYTQRDTDRFKQPISWTVLDKEENKVLLISTYVLNCLPFDGDHDPFYWPATWDRCTLRRWMNRDFLDSFNQEEKDAVLLTHVKADPNPDYDSDSGADTEDQVFCLSMAEIDRYYKSREEAYAAPTEYARTRGLVLSMDPPGYCSFWLRTAGLNNRFTCIIAPYGKRGQIALSKGSPYNSRYEGVRPAMWVDLSIFR
ncbi:MAG: hypothetical protein IKX76_00365 [Eubacterium sp.]|nr:hypothetical protein [Eubacterium sp.]